MARKGENIYHRKDGRWEGRYKLTGDEKYRSVYAKTYRECKEKRLKMLKNCSAKTVKTGFEKLCSDWLSSKKNRVKESTYSKYEHIIKNRFLTYFGKGKLNITSDKVKEFIDCELSESLSPKTVSEHFKLLKQIMIYADISYTAVFEKAKIFLPKISKNQVKVMDKTDRNKLENYLLATIDTRKLGVYLAMTLGLRIGEVCALQWKDFDFIHGTLNVSKTMQRIQISGDVTDDKPKTKVIISNTKTESGTRAIPLPSPIVGLLKNFKSDDESFILTGSKKFIEPRYLSKLFHKYLAACKISAVNFHVLRHTFATRFAEKTADYKALSEILGHSSPNITMNYYVHPSAELKRRSLACLL